MSRRRIAKVARTIDTIIAVPKNSLIVASRVPSPGRGS